MAASITLPPIESALETFRLHVVAQLPGSTVRRGIQELGEDQLGDAAEFSIVPISREVEYIVPTEVDRVDAAPTATVTWKVAQLRFTAQLDFWVPYRVLSDLASGPIIENLFYNRIPHQGGLTLMSNWYFDRPITVTAGAGIPIVDATAVQEGSWQKRWEVEFLTDLVVVAPIPIAAEIQIALSTQLGPDTVAEPDRIIT